MAFLDGITGQFYRQFATTIAIATVISAMNSLTLSPALSSALLKPRDAERDAPGRVLELLFGWLFRPFNRFFLRSSQAYEAFVGKQLSRRGAVLMVYLLLLVSTFWMFLTVHGDFVAPVVNTFMIRRFHFHESGSTDVTLCHCN